MERGQPKLTEWIQERTGNTLEKALLAKRVDAKQDRGRNIMGAAPGGRMDGQRKLVKAVFLSFQCSWWRRKKGHQQTMRTREAGNGEDMRNH